MNLNKMARLLMYLYLSMCFAQLIMAQVTLSRGWGPGKRGITEDECRINMDKLFARLNEIKVLLLRNYPDNRIMRVLQSENVI